MGKYEKVTENKIEKKNSGELNSITINKVITQ